MSATKPNTTRLPDGRMLRMAKATDRAGRLVNLWRHLLLLDQPDGSAYSMEPPRRDRPADIHRKLLAFHRKDLGDLYALLLPNEKAPNWATPYGRATGLRALWDLWHSLVVEGGGETRQVTAAMALAEGMVARWGVAAACYLHESEDVMPIGERLSLCGLALKNLWCDADRAALSAEFAALIPCVEKALARTPAAVEVQPTSTSPQHSRHEPYRAAAPTLTRSQSAAYDQLLQVAELYFSGAGDGPLAIRAQPLIVAPSGSGKSFLCRTISEHVGATYIRIARGDFCVQFSRWGVPTLFRVLNAVATSERVVLHFDELEKLSNILGTTAGDWGSTMACEIFAALDRVFPIEQWRAADPSNGGAGRIDTTGIEEKIRRRLLMIGSGAWQDVFDAHRDAKSLGFVPSKPTPVTSATIAAARLIPPELLLRFSSEFIILGHPTLDELTVLLDRFGLTQLAREVGEKIDPSSIDLRAGMRALETLRLKLLLRRRANDKQSSALADASRRREVHTLGPSGPAAVRD